MSAEHERFFGFVSSVVGVCWLGDDRSDAAKEFTGFMLSECFPM
jgi:hypothetical protein